ncbi:MAG: ACP S-malonyltransferase [Desulfovermiculus sp.]
MTEQTTAYESVLFPGQGSQERGMGRDLAESDEQVMELWRLAEKKSGARLREIFWDGDEQAMTQTRYQQPALFVTGMGLWRHLSSLLSPAFVAGHSVGEFTALAAAGALGVQEALDLVCLRGRFMFEAGEYRSGSMAAVLKLDEGTVQSIVSQACEQTEDELCVANYNSPQQTVISGARPALERALEMVRENKGRGKELPVSGAFHSRLMDEPARELAQVMEKMSWHRPDIPVHLNVTAQACSDPQEIAKALSLQMISPVLWSQLILNQWDKGIRMWWELGPKGVLTRLMRHILGEKEESWEAEYVCTLDGIEQVRERMR